MQDEQEVPNLNQILTNQTKILANITNDVYNLDLKVFSLAELLIEKGVLTGKELIDTTLKNYQLNGSNTLNLEESPKDITE